MTDRFIETDVLVVGGGTAGFCAAVAAGRFGLDVTLLEATAKVGGVMAFCPGMPWGAGYPADTIVGGILEELTYRLMAMDPPAAAKRPCTLENFGPEILYDPDIATLTMFEMLEEAHVHTLLHATALKPVVSNNTIKVVTCFDRNGSFTIQPKIVIDCSGDGDVSAKAGVPFELGDALGSMMGVTVSFHMVGVDYDAAFSDTDPYFTKFASAGVERGLLHPDLSKLYLMKGFYPGEVFCNSVHVRGVDGTDPVAVGKATQEGRRRCHQLAKFLKQEVPGFAHAHMAHLSPTVGVRETRKLQAIYRITGHDLARATKFPDGVVCCDNPVDDVMRDDGDMTHDAIVEPGAYYTIPFRALVPESIENLMFAGRIICADPDAFASVRGMPQCMIMGQACGTAASLAIVGKTTVQDVDHATLVGSLTQQGVNGLGGEPLLSGAAEIGRQT